MLDEIRLGGITLLHSVYEHINSNMYVLLAEDEELIIDPHKNEELTDLLKEKGIKRVTILLTHEHPDHIGGLFLPDGHPVFPNATLHFYRPNDLSAPLDFLTSAHLCASAHAGDAVTPFSDPDNADALAFLDQMATV